MERRTGMKFVCELPGDGWRLAVYKDTIIAAHPEHPPKMIRADGTVEELTSTNAGAVVLNWDASGSTFSVEVANAAPAAPPSTPSSD
jgi:hypothetical protein